MIDHTHIYTYENTKLLNQRLLQRRETEASFGFYNIGRGDRERTTAQLTVCLGTFTSLRCSRRTRATRCVTPIVI